MTATRRIFALAVAAGSLLMWPVGAAGYGYETHRLLGRQA